MRAPKIIYVTEELEPDPKDNFLLVHQATDSLEGGDVAVYKLVRKMKVRRLLQFKTDANRPWLDEAPDAE